MYMKLEFSTKLNIIREKRRLRAEHDRIERENNKNLPKQEEPMPKEKIHNKHSMKDKKILLQKLHFINNPNAQQPQKISPPTSINKNKSQINTSQINVNAQITQIKDNNSENMSIIVNEIIPCANNKFYE